MRPSTSWRPGSCGGLPNSVMSAPAMNVRPAQAMTMAPTPASAWAALRPSRNPRRTPWLSALTGGLLTVRTAMRPRRSRSTKGVMAVMSVSLSALRLGSGMLPRPQARIGQSVPTESFDVPATTGPVRAASIGHGEPPLVGGVETGGTKFVCAVGTGPADVRADGGGSHHHARGDPARRRRLLPRAGPRAPLAAIGIAAFGPLDLDPASPTYGSITTTPKPGWAGTDLVGTLRRGLGTPVAIDTDVNAAAVGEHRWGAARGLDTFVYLTVGTGIGGGALVNGRPLHGLVHPEMGHIRVPRDPRRRSVRGNLPVSRRLPRGPGLGARPGAALGAAPGDACPPIIPPGLWKLTTWPSAW